MKAKSARANPLILYLDNLAPSGRRSMRSLLKQAAGLLGIEKVDLSQLEELPWESLRYAQLAQVRAELMRLSKSANTINATLAALRGVMKTAFLLGQLPAEAWQRAQLIKRMPGQKLPAGRALCKAEVSALLRVCQRDQTALGQRDGAVIQLMVSGGLRRSEVVALEITDYNRRNGRVFIRQGKGNRERELVLPPQARESLKDWLRWRGLKPGPLCCNLSGDALSGGSLSGQAVYDLLRRRSQQARIAPCSPHDLRRTFITWLLEAGVDFNTTRRAAGHESIQTTARYDRRDEKSGQRSLTRLSV